MDNSTARRNEDIALDLLKIVLPLANVASKSSTATGFTPAAASKPEDQIAQVFDLYARCRAAVESPIK